MRSDIVTISAIASLTGHGEVPGEWLKRISAESFFRRKQTIVGIQLSLNFLAQRLGLRLINVDDANPPECAHGFTFQHGGGGFWRLGSGG